MRALFTFSSPRQFVSWVSILNKLCAFQEQSIKEKCSGKEYARKWRDESNRLNIQKLTDKT